MKQKTIVLEWYHIWGTKNSYALQMSYRGSTVYHAAGHKCENDKLLKSALIWAKGQGYTHWRMKTNMQGPRNIRKLEI